MVVVLRADGTIHIEKGARPKKEEVDTESEIRL
jgi:hypothetical protein